MSYNTCIIKNIDSVNHIILGVELAPTEIYSIPDEKRVKASNDDYILSKIGEGKLQINNGNADIIEVSKQINHLKNIDSFEVDDDNRQIIKTATTYKGWRYIAHPIEVETCKLNGIYEKDWTGSDRTSCSVEFFDSQDTKLIAGTQAELDASCTKTIVTFAPSFDLDIIGGNIHQHTTPTADVRIWVIAGAIDLKHLPGTVKEFVGGLNFKYITEGDSINTDGRASARLNKVTTGVPADTNKMQYIFTHPTGHKHQLMIVVEYFRA